MREKGWRVTKSDKERGKEMWEDVDKVSNMYPWGDNCTDIQYSYSVTLELAEIANVSLFTW